MINYKLSTEQLFFTKETLISISVRFESIQLLDFSETPIVHAVINLNLNK